MCDAPNETLRMFVPGVVSQHAEEAAFKWLLRDDAVRAPHYSLADLAELDERVEAHIDGLRIAGDPGWEICKQELAWEEPGEVFTAAVLAFEAGGHDRIEEVVNAGTQSLELSRGLISALGWLDYRHAELHVAAFLRSDSPLRSRVGIGACAVHREDPGHALNAALAAVEPELRNRALRAAGELGRVDLVERCREGFNAEDPGCRFWAAWSATLLGHSGALDVLVRVAEDGGRYAERACDLAARWMHPREALDWRNNLAARGNRQRLAVLAAGATGDPALVPWLIEMMAVNDVARPAGQAFEFITGVDLGYDDLEGERPEGFEAGPTENPEDEDVAKDPDEDLPWPAPELIEKWWKENRGAFQAGKRYLLGKEIVPETLGEVLRDGRQRQRAAAALELALLDPERPLFEHRAPGLRQQARLRRAGSQTRERPDGGRRRRSRSEGGHRRGSRSEGRRRRGSRSEGRRPR